MENIYQEQEIYNANLAILYMDYTMNKLLADFPQFREGMVQVVHRH